jgi:hypothetical protein
VVSPIGREIYVRDVDAYYHRNAFRHWTAASARLPASQFVSLQNVLGANASFTVKVENQTTNTPPGSPSPPTAYIIGSSPTGAWAGNAGKLAICLVAGTFTIIAPVAGDQIYDKARNTPFQFNGSAWSTTSGIFADTKSAFNNVRGGTSAVIPWDDTIPQISEGTQIIALNITPKSVTNKLRVRFDAVLVPDTGGVDAVAALFRDAIANALCATTVYLGDINHGVPISLVHEFVPATTSAVTLSVRVGPSNVAAVYWDGTSTTRKLGGSQAVSVTVDEIIA